MRPATPSTAPYYPEPADRPLSIHFDGYQVHMTVGGRVQSFAASLLTCAEALEKKEEEVCVTDETEAA